MRHLLEGSLRRDGDRVRLHVSLVDTRDGHEVWSEVYDRQLAEAISLQGGVANDIAEALNVTVSPEERQGVQAGSTRNPDAYLLYLQGRKLENSPTFEISSFEAADVPLLTGNHARSRLRPVLRMRVSPPRSACSTAFAVQTKH